MSQQGWRTTEQSELPPQPPPPPRRSAPLDSATQAASRAAGPDTALVFSIIAAVILAFAGLQMVTIESVAGNTIDEAFYNAVGVMCFGLAALSLAFGARR